MNQRGKRAAQFGMTAIPIVVEDEVAEQLAKMLKAADHRDTL